MTSPQDVKLFFADKKFHLVIETPNELKRSIVFDGTEARHIFNILDKAINTRPQSEDDRLSMEEGAKTGSAPEPKTE
jgi:hypothetical protein